MYGPRYSDGIKNDRLTDVKGKCNITEIDSYIKPTMSGKRVYYILQALMNKHFRRSLYISLYVIVCFPVFILGSLKTNLLFYSRINKIIVSGVRFLSSKQKMYTVYTSVFFSFKRIKKKFKLLYKKCKIKLHIPFEKLTKTRHV